jgi:hypothetical protein
MAIHGTFKLNNKSDEMSLLSFPGIGRFAAFSGNGNNKNQAGCITNINKGPIPLGKYWIVNRPTVNLIMELKGFIKDLTNELLLSPSDRSQWYALYRNDSNIDDYTWVNNVRRGNFRLHPKGAANLSLGCITLSSYSEFEILRIALLRTPPILISNTRIQAFGSIEVYADEIKPCPSSR